MSDASNNVLSSKHIVLSPKHIVRGVFCLEKPSGGEKKELAGQEGAASRRFFSEEAGKPRGDQKNSLDGKKKLFALQIRRFPL